MLKRLLTFISDIPKRLQGKHRGYSPYNKQTYFSDPARGIEGRRAGTDLSTRFTGLEFFSDNHLVTGSSILDVGCAEGLIEYELYKQGATTIHGLDLQHISIETARKIFSETTANTYFGQADVSNWEAARQKHQDALLSQYDIVLFLSIYQHLARSYSQAAADNTLSGLADVTKKYLAVRSPLAYDAAIIVNKGFEVVHHDPAPEANELTIFKRIDIS